MRPAFSGNISHVSRSVSLSILKIIVSMVLMRLWTIMLLLPLVGVCPLTLNALDANSNGLSDVWEKGYGTGMNPALDPDGDGVPTGQEEQAGTNPMKASDRFAVAKTTVTAHELTLEWPSVAGKWYSILVTSNLSDPNSWVAVGPGYVGTGDTMTAVLPDNVNTLIPGSVTRKRWNYQAPDLNWEAPTMERAKTSATSGDPANLTDTRSAIQTETVDVPDDQTVFFGEYLEGWIIPTTTGTYNLGVSSDDQSELRLGTTPGLPFTSRVAYLDNATWALTWNWYASQISAPIPLQAGKPYRFQVHHLNGWGDYCFAAGFKLSNQSLSQMKVLGTNGMNIASGYPSLKDYNLTIAQGLYAKIDVRDNDTDYDGLSDYEEMKLGLNRLRSQSTARLDDLPVAQTKLASGNTLMAGVSVSRGYEAEQTPAVFTIFRNGGIGAVTANYTLTGTATSGADYPAQTGSVVIPFGATSVTLPILPINDGVPEPAESLTLTLTPNAAYTVGSPSFSSVTIDDAADKLFIAPLRSVAGLNSPASGFASLRMVGNKSSGVFTLNFTNLSSPEMKGEIYLVKPDNVTQVVVLTLSAGQVAKLDWLFNAVPGATSAEITSALENGRMYIRLCSTTNPTGEAVAQFLPNLGWQTMPTPPTPPVYTPGLTDAEAARFLVQATFGPTLTDIATLKTKGYATWLADQINSTTTPPTLHLPYVKDRRVEYTARTGDPDSGWQGPRQEAWWEASIRGNDQLRQRMAFALSEIFVVSDIGVLDGSHEGITNWYDMLVTNAFGNYRTLLKNVTLSPIMGQYLSMALNRKADFPKGTEPDENYAREVQQLFSIGLYELNLDGSARLNAEGLPIPTYTQKDIVSFARCFTGWGFAGSPADQYWKPYPINASTEMLPMVQYPDYHDLGAKILHSHTIPENTAGGAEMDIAMDDLFNHPNVGPFIARQLIQRFVTSNPSPGYIYRVAAKFNNNGAGVRGDLGAVITAVLMDYEARSPTMITKQGFGKLKEPVIRLAHMYRAGSVAPPNSADHWFLAANSGKPARFFLDTSYSINQAPLKSGSVFNFFQPGYIPPGRMAFNGLFAPEFQIFSETSTIGQINFQQSCLAWGTWTSEVDGSGNNRIVNMALTDEIAIINTIKANTAANTAPNFTTLIDHLDKELMAGQMSSYLRGQLNAYFTYTWANGSWWNLSTANYVREHAVYALGLVYASPEFAIQK